MATLKDILSTYQGNGQCALPVGRAVCVCVCVCVSVCVSVCVCVCVCVYVCVCVCVCVAPGSAGFIRSRDYRKVVQPMALWMFIFFTAPHKVGCVVSNTDTV